jgi:hypothetical protein
MFYEKLGVLSKGLNVTGLSKSLIKEWRKMKVAGPLQK